LIWTSPSIPSQMNLRKTRIWRLEVLPIARTGRISD
jgi:hypothetical protein